MTIINKYRTYLVLFFFAFWSSASNADSSGIAPNRGTPSLPVVSIDYAGLIGGDNHVEITVITQRPSVVSVNLRARYFFQNTETRHSFYITATAWYPVTTGPTSIPPTFEIPVPVGFDNTFQRNSRLGYTLDRVAVSTVSSTNYNINTAQSRFDIYPDRRLSTYRPKLKINITGRCLYCVAKKSVLKNDAP
ncbi:MAG: hypothetical protein NTU80_06140 [Verrucomicrobia bacterium]|nr:hypothetical protein [Verrucomicrobiota bacterium]